MLTAKNKIVILDIINYQEQYALCLELIKILEGQRFPEKELVEKIREKILIAAGEFDKNRSPRYIEQPIIIKERNSEGEEKLVMRESVTNKHLMSVKEIEDLHRHHGDIQYQIRIHMQQRHKEKKIDKSEFIHLQYLALLLRNLEDLSFFERMVQKRLMIFVVPMTGENYPYVRENGEMDSDTYHLMSQYLRLLSANYNGVIYGAIREGMETVVTTLDYRKDRKYETYFPVVLINKEKYTKLFDINIGQDIFSELFSLSKTRRFRDSRNDHPEVALCDFLLETSIKHLGERLRNVWQDEKVVKNKLKIIESLLSQGQEQNIIQFCLFAFMFYIETAKSEDEFLLHAKNTCQLAQEVCQGIKQVVQNSIQYSQIKGCFLSFYLHESQDDENVTEFNIRMSREYEKTELHPKERGKRLEALEVYIADLNEKEDMLENFIRNLEYEMYANGKGSSKSLSGHKKLLAHSEQLAIRNFFSEYKEEDRKEEWKEFRCNDIVAHVGLSLFALVAKQCKASIKVISNKSAKLNRSKNYFYKSYSSDTLGDIEGREERYVIPGTQFSILLPVHEWEKKGASGLGQLQYQNSIAENYASFADFIDYEEKRDAVDENEVENMQAHVPNIIASARGKYELLQIWIDFWNRRIRDTVEYCRSNKCCVYNHDFDKLFNEKQLENQDNMELCIKGMIVALDRIVDEETGFFIAITNLPTGTLEIFRKISILLSPRSFPTNLQLCLCEKEHENMMILLGEDMVSAIFNSYILSLEHGIHGFSRVDYENALALKEQLFQETKGNSERKDLLVKVFPFDTVLTCSEYNKQIMFEEKIMKIAEKPLDNDEMGYKLNETHMRLGSKVHIEAFYEMSFLFYRTTIANRVAFIILRRMIEEKIDILNDTIIFYGYASYSKAILTSITEILKVYRREKGEGNKKADQVAFASYQHNLQLESEEIQMYFGLPDNFSGKLDEDNHLNLKGNVTIIQIVPISSTLTTFEKMWNMFKNSVAEDSQRYIKIKANYTVFWVVDEKGIISGKEFSDIEKKYWESRVSKRTIKTKFMSLKNAGNEYVNSFMQSAVKWNNPLLCEQCYPDRVIEEFPLVETDPTSTVPSQQIRYKSLTNYKQNKKGNEEENNERLLDLKDCIFYGHISRRQNHYQYYVDTQKYFYKVKSKVRDWLENINGNNDKEMHQPILRIIFSPEHNTNVGFAQYVNTYYFSGLAEIISVNVDKEFRSNFKCEHAALIKIIENLHINGCSREELPVRFYFVDDTIITGETYEKANSFMHSLIPENVRDFYPSTLFSKIFLLMDRLSDDTKYMYVERIEDNFLSFVHIDVSNIRTRGNSCIGCDLENRAQKMFKRSATKNLASYWAQKMNDYKRIAYDDRKKMKKIDKQKSYSRLIISHVLQNVIVKSGNAYVMGSTYDILLYLCLGMLIDSKEWKKKTDIDESARDKYGYASLLHDVQGIEGVKTAIKIICRPFFAYEYKIKTQVLTLIIFLAECMLGESAEEIMGNKEDSKKVFLHDNQRGVRTQELFFHIMENLVEECDKVDFLQNYLLEGLTDMGSNYLMRKETFKKMYLFMQNVKDENLKSDFWKKYAIHIYRLLTNSADETKEVWIETLYMTGKEYKDFVKKEEGEEATNRYMPQMLYETITGKTEIADKDYYFYQFCCELFLQNTGLNFDGLEKRANAYGEKIAVDYFMDCWKQMRALSQFKKELTDSDLNLEAEDKLFQTLKWVKEADEVETENKKSVNKWYQQLLKQFAEAINEKYKEIKKEEINIALITENLDENEKVEGIQRLDIVKERLTGFPKAMPAERYEIKSRIIAALENITTPQFDLKKNGYLISADDPWPYCIIFFDNPNLDVDEKAGRSLSTIERVFLYLSIKGTNMEAKKKMVYLQLILRDILMYRNRILRFLERDFTGDIFSRYAHTVGEKSILSHEKAASHNTSTADEITIEIFINKDAEKVYKCLTKKGKYQREVWLLLRNYTNVQIAKIFNRSFSNSVDDDGNGDIPVLYMNDDKVGKGKKLYRQKLRSFSEVEIAEDGRFALLNQVMEIDYHEVKDAEFVVSESGEYYNKEFFKCILIDICMSAIKYKTAYEDFLLRIDRLLFIEDKYREAVENMNVNRIEYYKKKRCTMRIFRKSKQGSEIDFLVIRNHVDKYANDLVDWEERNKTINKRLHDPFDYIDGHMSLLAIKRYIENLHKTVKEECWFRYEEAKSEYGETEGLYFETGLPILKKESDGNGKNIIMD